MNCDTGLIFRVLVWPSNLATAFFAAYTQVRKNYPDEQAKDCHDMPRMSQTLQQILALL